MRKKYRTEEEKDGLLRIIALRDFSDVKKGDRGGLISQESNLSQEGDCWVYEFAQVYGDAQVLENAQIFGDAQIYGNAWISGNAKVSGNACVYDNAKISGKARVSGFARIGEKAKVYGNAGISETVWVEGNAQVYDSAEVFGNARICGNAKVYGRVKVWKKAHIGGNVKLRSTETSYITTSIKNNKDYTILIIKQKFFVFPNNHAKDIIDDCFPITVENYLKNIQTIRQLYGKEIYNRKRS